MFLGCDSVDGFDCLVLLILLILLILLLMLVLLVRLLYRNFIGSIGSVGRLGLPWLVFLVFFSLSLDFLSFSVHIVRVVMCPGNTTRLYSTCRFMCEARSTRSSVQPVRTVLNN